MSNNTTTPSRRRVVSTMTVGTMATFGSPAGSAQAQTAAKTFVIAPRNFHPCPKPLQDDSTTYGSFC
jgi:hypothetical protein